MKMNKKLITALLIAVIALVCINIDSTDLSDRAVVEALGLDYKDNRYILTVQFYNPTTTTAPQKSQTKVLKGEGKTISQAIEDINSKNSRELYLSHNSFIALGIDCTVNIAEVLNYFHSDNQTRPDVLLVVTDKAEDMIKFTSDENTTPAQSVGKILKNATKKGTLTDMRLFKIIALRESKTSDYALPFITVKSSEIVPNGTIVFKNDNLALFLDEDKTRGVNFVNQKIKSAVLTVDDTSFKIISTTPKIKIKKEKDVFEFIITVNVTAKSEGKNPNRILEEEIHSNVQNAITTAFLEGGCDLFHFGEISKQKGEILSDVARKKVTILVNCQFE